MSLLITENTTHLLDELLSNLAEGLKDGVVIDAGQVETANHKLRRWPEMKQKCDNKMK
jgi:hypothetical protein